MGHLNAIVYIGTQFDGDRFPVTRHSVILLGQHKDMTPCLKNRHPFALLPAFYRDGSAPRIGIFARLRMESQYGTLQGTGLVNT